MFIPCTRAVLCVLSAGYAGLAVTGAATAQCDLLLRDTFRFGPRPHGGNGRERVVELEDRLHDYWPQASSIGARWMSADRADQPLWQFAWSSSDPAEFDPLETDGGGIAYGFAGAAVVIPFEAPATAFTMAADVVGSPLLGYTSSPSFLSNFRENGALWISLDTDVRWTLYVNGSEVVATGISNGGGAMNGGFYRIEMTYEPATGQVRGSVAGEPFGPYRVNIILPTSYFGMEAGDSVEFSSCGVNNLAVYTGERLAVEIETPASACLGGGATLTARSNAPDPAGYAWMRNEYTILEDGVQPSGAVVSGARTSTLTIENIGPEELGAYSCAVLNDCGLAFSGVGSIGVCVGDFDCGGSVTSQDLFSFLGAFFALSPSADVNHDGRVSSQDFFEYLGAFFDRC